MEQGLFKLKMCLLSFPLNIFAVWYLVLRLPSGNHWPKELNVPSFNLIDGTPLTWLLRPQSIEK